MVLKLVIMTRILATSLVLTVLLIGGSSPVSAKKLALVVGVNDYENLSSLMNAVNDADAIALTLRDNLDFEYVKLIKDPETSFAQIRSAWAELLANVERDDTVVFFFSGHGLEVGALNFLLPKDVPLNPIFPSEVALGLQEMMDEVARRPERKPALSVFIVDACRNNPIGINVTVGKAAPVVKSESFVQTPNMMKSSRERGFLPIKANEKRTGLSPVRPPQNVFVMYSAGIGQTALDGLGENSVYTTELLSELSNLDRGLADLAQSIRYRVYRAARQLDPKHNQTPAYYDQLMERINLLGQRTKPSTYPAPEQFLDVPDANRLASGDIIIECDGCPELAVIPAGEFAMGSPLGEAGRAANEGDGQRQVTIPAKLAIGRYEVTNREWNLFAGSAVGPCKSAELVIETAEGREREPVTNISWFDAKAYVDWLSCITRADYRLPSEAEWEYAARAGSTGRYSFAVDGSGTEEVALCQFANGSDLSARVLFYFNTACDDGFGRRVAQVGSYLPNAFRLHDVHGNVSEWVSDCWQAVYDASANDRDARRTLNGTCGRRAVRGGSWRSAPSALRSAARHAFDPAMRRATLGFRVVRELTM